MTLEQLINLKVTVTSKTALNSRESPGIVSIITNKEIEASGARDLIDILRMVPGLTFSYDVGGVVGLAARGNWGHEGKILLMIDGQEMNENLYSTTQFGNRYNVDQIKRIEVIRGPGSSIYGGYAELGVINVITKKGRDLNGIQLDGSFGIVQNSYARQNISLQAGKESKNLSYSLAAFMGRGIRSNAMFTDIYGNSGDLTDNSELKPFNFNLNVTYKDLKVLANYENYQTTSLMYYDAILNNPAPINYESVNLQALYDWKITKKVTITPKISFINQSPWNTRSAEGNVVQELRIIDTYYDVNVTKAIGNLSGNVDFNRNLNMLLGVEFFVENAMNNDPNNRGVFLNNTSDQVDFNTISGFGQLLYRSNSGNFTAGGRIINHNQFGSAFAPRFGYTKIFGNFHTKLLFSRAFRAPVIENMNLNPNVKPEKTNVAEIEVGLKITNKMFLTANIFDITIEDPIIYFFDDMTGNESYLNFDQSGSRGFELEYKIKEDWGFATFSYSFSSTAGKNKAPLYEVPINSNAVLGIPQSKMNLISSFRLSKNFSINPSFTLIGKRYGYASVDLNEAPILETFGATPLLNINLRYDNFLTNGFSISFGVFDLLDEHFDFIQPYNGYHSPLPGLGRELVMKIGYDLKYR